jgi:hypothetical protein
VRAAGVRPLSVKVRRCGHLRTSRAPAPQRGRVGRPPTRPPGPPARARPPPSRAGPPRPRGPHGEAPAGPDDVAVRRGVTRPDRGEYRGRAGRNERPSRVFADGV